MKIRIMIVYCLIVLVIVFSGCMRGKESDRSVVAVQDTLRAIGISMNNGGEGFSLSRNYKKISEQFAVVSNFQQRLNLSMEYAKIILSVDFKGQDYRHRANAVGLYFDYLEHCFWMMKKNDVPPPCTLDFFFKGLAKYKATCFGVSLAEREKDESIEMFCDRKGCARSMVDDYEQTMSEIKRFWLPRLATRFPEELHDEFRRRIEPFFDFPSKQEILNAPLFGRGAVGPRKIRSPVTPRDYE